MRRRMAWRSVGAAAAVLLAAACSGDAESPTNGSARAAASVPLTGTVIEVGMHGIGDQYFDPKAIEARRGDVVKFVLVSGVHNASFPADRNPAGVKLPETTPYLQAPGQTHEMTVDLPPGEYFFQCDPHIALGMVGTLTVVE